MTKVVALCGSPNKHRGYSGKMVESLISGVEAAGATVELHHLYDYSILPCLGCYKCSKHGKCVLQDKDDQFLLEELLIGADGFVLASPNYMNSVTAKMKGFFDRSFSRLFHCQKLRKKYAATVISSGGPLYETVENYFDNVLLDMYCAWKVGSVGAPERIMDDEDGRPDTLEEAARLGRRLVEAIESEESFPEQLETHERTFEVLEYLVTTQPVFAFERDYWKKHWGLVD
jgi:multimeric flavodoxin WrbA